MMCRYVCECAGAVVSSLGFGGVTSSRSPSVAADDGGRGRLPLLGPVLVLVPALARGDLGAAAAQGQALP